MAGLYNFCTDKNGNPYTGFVIITTDANKDMSEIHNRMPVILTKDETELLLQNEPINSNELKNLFVPFKGLITLDRVG